MDHQQSVKYKSTTIKTLWLARTVTSPKERCIRTYSIGLTILGKLSFLIRKKKKVLEKLEKVEILKFLLERGFIFFGGGIGQFGLI